MNINPVDPASLILSQPTNRSPSFSASPEVSQPLPGFLAPLPASMNNEDASYLRRRGSLDLPATSLQNDLIEWFTDHVYSYVPIVDLHSFFQLVQTHNGRRGQISLPLYQAVLFSASLFVDNTYLSGTGFSSREDAQNTFFLWAHWLYDLGYESNRLPIVQSLLLMSFRQGPPDTIKDDGWYWLGAAISMAYAVDLHHALSITDKSSLTQGLRKRLWWSCYTHELVMSLATQRPMRIGEEDFDIPM
ncbi:hypothetical protein FOFC_05583 [Fusarium oxysporum]|nr:hypothetical protein FOFC_05583 [Fusarium oxysporum]